MLRLTTQNPTFVRLHTYLAQHWFGLVLAILVVLAILGLVLRLITPQRTTTIPNLVQQGNPDGSQTDFTGLTFSGQTPQVPEKMWVARVTNFTVASSDKILKSLISAYNLKQSANVDTMWIGLDYTLSYFEDSNTYNLSQNDLAPVDPPQTIAPSDVSQLVTVAQKWWQIPFLRWSLSAFPIGLSC